MRPVHVRVAVVASVLAVVVGVAAALVAGRDRGVPTQPAAAPTPTMPTPAAVGGDTAKAGSAGKADPAGPTGRGPGVSTGQAAKAAAVAFLRGLGMRDPVAASYRSTGPATAEVGLHPRAGEGGRRLDEVTTLVQLRRYTGGWVATGARAVDTIEVDQPLAFSRIISPVTVSGTSLAYEGTVSVTVTEDLRGDDRVLGTGFVNGGATELAPFSGPISFARPSGEAGWVIFRDDTGGGPDIMAASAVRVRFVADEASAQIFNVTTDPAPSASANLVTLTGSGTLTVRLKATDTQEVRFLLVPAGTGGRPHARLLGVDTRSEGQDRWSLSWRYPDEPFHGHLLIQANGWGGTAEHDRIAVLHT
jgi:hypothetical protein